MTQLTIEDTDQLLARLSQKAGVQSTLVLARDTGAIVRSSGLISSTEPPSQSRHGPQSPSSLPPDDALEETTTTTAGADGLTRAEEVARMVWIFIGAAAGLATGLDEHDELKLLRLRTKKIELVIVPGPKFILVAIHDTPPA